MENEEKTLVYELVNENEEEVYLRGEKYRTDYY